MTRYTAVMAYVDTELRTALQRAEERWQGIHDAATDADERLEAEEALRIIRGDTESARRTRATVQRLHDGAERIREVVEKHGTPEAKAYLAARTRLNGA